jgi:hypothetical protein
MWKLIQKLFGQKSLDIGQVQSLPSLPSESKKNLVSVPPAKKKKEPSAVEGLVEIARSQVGVKEVGGNNRGAKIREYQSTTTLKPAPWPWCAAFCCWVIDQWLKDPQNTSWLNLKQMTPSQWRPRTAAAFGFIEWAKKRPATTKILSENAKPQVGDLVVFDFSHIGIVVGVGEKNFQCVEGNTNQKGTRDSDSGDGVWLKTRTSSLVRNYIRIIPSKAQ